MAQLMPGGADQQHDGHLPAPAASQIGAGAQSPFANETYQVGWISALPIELAAASGMLDEEHGSPQTLPQKTDANSYVLGRIHSHKVVIACLPKGEIGAVSAAVVARDLLLTFPNIRIGLMVGIGAGIPRRTEADAEEEEEEDDDDDDDDVEDDVHLGDVVISSDKKTGGVVAYNFGKRLADGSFEVAYHLDQPPRVLRTALAKLEAAHEARDNLIPGYIAEMLAKFSSRMASKWVHPGLAKDVLYPTSYLHSGGKTCKKCDAGKAIRNASESRSDDVPVIHYGVIATGSEVVRHAPTRDQIRSEHSAICLEMEAAGLMNSFPCLVIRGISDYADSHKNDQWHRYAAAAAAACAKELLLMVQPTDVDNHPKASEIVGRLENMEKKIELVNTGIKAFSLTSQQDKLRKWLSASDPEGNLSQSLEQYHPGTCIWLLQGEKLKSWKQTPHESLWINGIPGSGKTIVCSKIIANLITSRELGGAPCPLFFFFDTRDAKKQTLSDMLRSLISQLYSVSTPSRKILDAVFLERFESGNKQPTLRDLNTIFSSMIQASDEAFKVVLDALDESSTQEQVLGWIRASRPDFMKVGFLVTSRNEKPIELGIREWLGGEYFASLEENITNKDIARYVQYYLSTERSFKRWKDHPDVIQNIEEAIVGRADGMFRLAVCQLEVLKDCVDIGEIEHEINRLPTSLEGVYDRILHNIQEHHHARVVRILQFLVYSQRPLRTHELIDALAVDLRRNPEFEPGRRMPDPQGILEMCPSLITTRESITSNDRGLTQTCEFVELAHATVKEYLVLLGGGNKFHDVADPIKSQGMIARVCMSYLSCINNIGSLATLEATFPLIRFSSWYWFTYARGSDVSADVRAAVIDFLSRPKTMDIWSLFYNPDFPWNDTPEPFTKAQPLYYASLAGLFHTAKVMLEKGVDPMASGGAYGSAVQAAAAAGYEKVVTLLLEQDGVDVNNSGGLLGNILQAAATQDNETTIRLLLHKGAKIQAQGGKYGNALQAASARGNYAVVNLLLSNGADPNIIGGKYNTALDAACLRGYADIVRVLLNNGANSNTQAATGITPLQAAVEADHIEIVQMLLNHGATVNHKSGLYGNGLQLASVRGNYQVVALLLNSGADPNLSGGLFGNALQAAAARGDNVIVKLLLDAGSNVNATGGYYNTALQAASAQGRTQVLKLLIERGADVNLNNQEDDSPRGRPEYIKTYIANMALLCQDYENRDNVALASQVLPGENVVIKSQEFHDDDELVNQLLEDEVQPEKIQEGNQVQGIPRWSELSLREKGEAKLIGRLLNGGLRDMFHANALQAASGQGHVDAARILIDAGAELDTSEGIYGCALQAASAQGRYSGVEVLLRRGANPNRLGGYYGSALQAACARGHHSIASLLLEHWAEPHIRGGIFEAPLIAAAARGHHRIVKVLLESIPHVNASSDIFQKALYAASRESHTEVVASLLQRGSEMDIKGTWYINGLLAAVRNGHFNLVKMLLDGGADPNVLLEGVPTNVLQVAASQGDVKITELLIDAGADVNRHGNPLAIAANRGHANVMRLLLRHGANVNRNAFREAVCGGHGHAVQLLIEKGYDVECSDIVAALKNSADAVLHVLLDGLTADTINEFRNKSIFEAAAQIGDLRTLRLFLKLGYYPRSEALGKAAAKGHQEVVSMLLKVSTKTHDNDQGQEKALQAAAEAGHKEIVRLLLNNMVEVNLQGGTYGRGLQVALCSAAENNHEEIVQMLLHASTDFNVLSDCRYGMLQAAARKGDELLVKNLLGLGCRSTLDTNLGIYGNPLQAAAVGGHYAIARLLLGHGANVNQKGGVCKNPLRAAVSIGSVAITRLLLEYGAHVRTHNGKGVTSQQEIATEEIFSDLESSRGNEDIQLPSVKLSTVSEEMTSTMSQTSTDSSEDSALEEGIPSTLRVAAVLGHKCIIKLLLDAGADMNDMKAPPSIEWPPDAESPKIPDDVVEFLLEICPIHAILEEAIDNAVESGNHGILKKLVDWVAALDAVISYDKALNNASRLGQEQAVILLLKAGADPNFKGVGHGSLINRVLEDGQEQVAFILLQAGADVTTEPLPSIRQAIRKGFKRIWKAIINLQTERKDEWFRFSLQFAGQKGQEDIMLLILEMAKASDISLSDEDALILATAKGFEKVIGFVLERGVKVQIQSPPVYDALIEVMESGNEHAARLVIEASDSCKQQTESDATLLHVAANKGFIRTVNTLVEKGMGANSESSKYGHAIQAAAMGGQIKMVNLLRAWGADINAQGGYHGDALKAASWYGFPRLVTDLLEAGARTDSPGGEYGSALQAASAAGHLRIVQILINAGADVNAQGGQYGVALHAAAAQGHTRVMRLLIEQGARISEVDGNGLNVLQTAASQGHIDAVKELLRHGASINPQSGFYGNALQAAVSRGHLRIAELLLDQGADVAAVGGQYGFALRAAASQGNVPMVELLLERGAPVDMTHEPNGTALEAAVLEGKPGMAYHLVMLGGADVNAPTGRQYGYALQAAVLSRHPRSLMRELLTRGADINAVGGRYGTALQAAATTGNAGVVRELLDSHADIHIKAGEFGYALQAASVYGFEKIVEMLLEHGANVNTQGGKFGSALLAACYFGHGATIQLLLGHKADVDLQIENLGGPLQAASLSDGGELDELLWPGEAEVFRQYRARYNASRCEDREEVVKTLLDQGADANKLGGKLGSALQAASRSGALEVVTMLLEAGAEVNMEGGMFGSALAAAADGGHEIIIKILLENGADINGQGCASLRNAVARGYKEVANILRDAGASLDERDKST